MSILINHDTKLIVQGITGQDGSLHAMKMKEYGINVVGRTSPGKAGQEVIKIPVFNTVKDVMKITSANTSVIFVPAVFTKDAMLEAANAGIQLIICITGGVLALDTAEAYRYISDKGTKLIGPNYPGLISPEENMVSTMPASIFKKGYTDVTSRSGTLTYQVVADLTAAGFGQSIAMGVGGNPIAGSRFQDLLGMFQNDPETDSIALIDEIGGDTEERAVDHIKQHVIKSAAAFISGHEIPEGRQMGHASVIVSSSSGAAAEKIAALEAAGMPVTRETCEIPALLRERM